MKLNKEERNTRKFIILVAVFLFLASCAGVYISGLAGDQLYKKVGSYFNASDLCDEIPKTMKELLN